jgi:PAS domain S-box-containing protein
MSAQISELSDSVPPVRQDDWQFRDLLAALPAAIYTTDSAGRITFFNEAAAQLWGCRPQLGSSEWCGSWRLYRPDGTPLAHDECPMATSLKENRPVRNVDAVAERPDGTRVPFMPYSTPLHDSRGALVGAVNMLVDITDQKRAEQRVQALIDELNHRVRNTLATVQSIAAQSFRGRAVAQAQQWFEGRLMALSKAHDVLSRENWKGADLRDVVTQTVTPMSVANGNSLMIGGPDLQVPPPMAVSLAMVIHELAANAVKYGALSLPAGHVTITWSVDDTDDGQRLHLRWIELDGPVVQRPAQKGFGSRLIEHGIAHQLGASVQLQFPASGVVCEIDVPLR